MPRYELATTVGIFFLHNKGYSVFIFVSRGADGMKISISAAATYYSPQKRSIERLALDAQKTPDWSKKTGIKELHIIEDKFTTTDVAALVGRKAIDSINFDPEDIDQLVYISEGISDYLYMDTSKTVIKKIGGRTDGSIYSYDFHRGSNGTIGVIKFIGNQISCNPLIKASLIDSALLWEHHSNKRLLGETFLGDGAGALLLQKDLGYNRVLGIALADMSEFNLVNGFKYGGTRHDLTEQTAREGKFVFDILDEEHLKGVLNNVVSFSVEAGKKALADAGVSAEEIDYIGISGFHQKYNDHILSEFPREASVINPLETMGYLGTVGVMEVLKSFINNESIKRGSTMLVMANGIDINVEAMVIRK